MTIGIGSAYGGRRGMSKLHDIKDCVGSYPYEVATPDQVFKFYCARSMEGHFLGEYRRNN